jgi:hypothetical protein
VEAARAERFQEARAAFEQSYALAERPITLLNLAAVQAELGLLVDAAESYRHFIAQPGRRTRRHVPEARRALAAIEPRIPHVRLRIEGLRSGDLLRIDGEEVSHAVVGGDLPVNPGEHELAVERDGATAALRSFSLAERERRDVAVTVQPPAPIVTAVDDEEDEGRSVASSPWLWTGVGAAVAAVVVTSVVVARGGGGGGGGGPFRGNVGPGVWEVE